MPPPNRLHIVTEPDNTNRLHSDLMNSYLQRSQPSQLTHCPSGRRPDKQARLERLRATAIEVPEPEVVQLTAKILQEAAPEVSIWKLLAWLLMIGVPVVSRKFAAQGRRPEDVSLLRGNHTWLKVRLDKTRRNLVNQLKIISQGPL